MACCIYCDKETGVMNSYISGQPIHQECLTKLRQEQDAAHPVTASNNELLDEHCSLWRAWQL